MPRWWFWYKKEDPFLNDFTMGEQQQQHFWFNQHQQQLIYDYQLIQHQLYHRRLLLATLLQQQREERAMDLLYAIHRERTRNDPHLEWHTVSQDSQQRQWLDWFIPQHWPGDGFGGDDDLLREFIGGFVPRQRDEQLRLMLMEGGEEPPLPRSSDDLPFPSGERIQGGGAGESGGVAGGRNPFGL